MNPNFQDKQSSSRSIFESTLSLIGSATIIMIFVSLLFGIFTSSLDRMLWSLFDWLVEILKPIAAIVALFIALFRIPPMFVSLFDSFVEEMRMEREATEIWDRLDSSPTPIIQTKTIETLASQSEKIDNSFDRVGDKFDFSKYKPGSTEAANAYKNSNESKINQERIKELDRIINAQRQKENEEINNAVENKLKNFSKKVKQNRVDFERELEDESYC